MENRFKYPTTKQYRREKQEEEAYLNKKICGLCEIEKRWDEFVWEKVRTMGRGPNPPMYLYPRNYCEQCSKNIPYAQTVLDRKRKQQKIDLIKSWNKKRYLEEFYIKKT
jgi:hypothetical protein